jgi:predicted DCC family thiol-disulfide oxidoreductase YuxK
VPGPPLPHGDGSHLILYDGVCGLCNRLNRFVLAHDARGTFDFASQQSEVGRAYLERRGEDDRALTTLFVIANYRTPDSATHRRADAVLFVLGELGGFWRGAARAAAALPGAALDSLYTVTARHRYRLFGRLDQCPLPAPGTRHRFIDV